MSAGAAAVHAMCKCVLDKMQSASLALTTTPSEEIALALQQLMWPLTWLGVPVKQVRDVRPVRRLLQK